MPSFIKELQAPLPETFPNYKGEQTKIKWPKGDLLARSGDVFLFKSQMGSVCFVVVYGLEITKHLCREEAAEEFGQCCFHQAECVGLLQP